MGVSDASLDNTLLADSKELRKSVSRVGILPVASQVFGLGMIHQNTTPNASKEILLLRANAQVLNEHMNALGPNQLFSSLVRLEEDLR